MPNKNCTTRFRVTSQEQVLLIQVATEAGMSVSEYIRWLVIYRVPPTAAELLAYRQEKFLKASGYAGER